MTAATVRCRACNSIVQGDTCDICGAPPMILPPRVPTPAKLDAPKAAPSAAPARRAAASKLAEDRKWIEEYQRTHPGATPCEAAMARLHRREGTPTVFDQAAVAVAAKGGKG